MSDPSSAAAAAAAAAAATNLQNLQAFLAASAAFPGLLSHGGAAAGLLAGLPGGLHSALAMQGLQGLQGLFGSLPAAAAAAATKHSANVMSPPAGATPSPGAGRNADSIIDFSSKRPAVKMEKETDAESHDDAPPPTRRRGAESSPLDLSSGVRKRDRSSGGSAGPAEKRRSDSISAASMAGWKAGASHDAWNGHHKNSDSKNSFVSPPDASKALERMTELSRLSGESRAGGAGGGRQSAWQSHWLSKGADTAKDVLKCVWCKLSFETLAALTTHMKESKHCGVNASLMSSASSASGAAGSVNSSPVASSPSSSQQHNQPQASPSSHQSDRSLPTASHPPSSSASTNTSGRGHHSSSSSSNNHDLLLKESGQVQLPRKLVRGQDVWLGKGAEQTRQILKCMWCGQSFRSLAEMTTHMQQTQHYTNIISQEQIISWKAADGEGGAATGSGKGSSGSGNHQHQHHGQQQPPPPPQQQQQQQQQQSHVNAVLTCKVCDQAFASLKELSSHMVKNSHYKEHIMRSISESGGRRRQARDKRKKALPVRKLLELERAQQEARSLTQQQSMPAHHHGSVEQQKSSGRISCEKCGDKIETSGFVDHIRQCVGGSGQSMRAGSKSSTPSPSVVVPKSEAINGSGRKTPKSKHQTNPSPRASPMSVGSANGSDAPAASSTPTKDGSPSVLNAIEKLIEKSFDAGQGGSGGKAKAAAAANPTGSNILRRLGIDESLDYSKPLMDPLMTVNMLRLYGYGQAGGHQRERTTSEASSSNASASAAASNGDHPQQSQQRDSGKSTPRSANGGGSPLRSRSPSQSPSGVQRRRRKDPSPSPASPTLDADANPSSPAASSVSERSLRSATPATQLSSPEGAAGRRSQSQTPTDVQPARSSLNALSSMFDGLSSAAAPSSGGTSSGGGFNPLAALQKLCDKTETHSPSSSGRPNSLGGAGSSAGGSSGSGSGGGGGGGSGGSGSSAGSAGTNPGAILAFSWACNDAVMTDSIMKCAFCDTQFISKGAYRHHLSKMHFVKDAAGGSAAPTLKASSGGSSSTSAGTKGSSSSAGANAASAAASPQPPAGANSFENESPHSKFLKYTELAKQLSSKYVWKSKSISSARKATRRKQKEKVSEKKNDVNKSKT